MARAITGDALALARRLEANDARTASLAAAGAHAAFGGLGVVTEAVAGGVMTFAGRRSPLTRARGLGMEGPVSDEDIARIDAFFGARGCSPTLDVCPYADPSLLAALVRRGYQPTGFSHVMVRPLGRDVRPTRVHDGVRVEHVAAGGAATWSRVVARGFGGDGTMHEGVFEAGVGLFHTESAACVWGFVSGEAGESEPVGGGALVVDPHDAALAYLFATSTQAPARGRGVQSALIDARLVMAAARGCSLAWVAASPGSASQRNLERAGFGVVYTRVEMQRLNRDDAKVGGA